VVGRENVIGGNDCGFATFAGSNEIHSSIVWAKLGALVEGAHRASRELWPRRRRPAAAPKAAKKKAAATAKSAKKKAAPRGRRPQSTKGRRTRSG
jgi:5-methyltetrahydropteroyltriglutamate--homocysteine methyltransferase